MMRYDPDRQPDPERWRGLDEGTQMQLVIDYHRRARQKLPNASLHACFHVIVENQVLLGDETPVAATLDGLMREGLDRHNAVHAIGSVLVRFIYDIVGDKRHNNMNEEYFREVEKLTAEAWLSEAE